MPGYVRELLGWLVIIGIIAAFIFGRRRGKAARSDAIASAVAAARVDWDAELASFAHATATQTVMVDASTRHGAVALDPAQHACDDPVWCPVCGPVLRRFIERQRNVATYDRPHELDHEHHVNHDDHDDSDSADLRDGVVRSFVVDPARLRGIPVGAHPRGTDRSSGSDRAGAADRDGSPSRSIVTGA